MLTPVLWWPYDRPGELYSYSFCRVKIILLFPYLSGFCFSLSLCNLGPHDRKGFLWASHMGVQKSSCIFKSEQHCRDAAWSCGCWATRVPWCVPTLQWSPCCGGTAESSVACGGVLWSSLPWLAQKMWFLPLGHLGWHMRRRKSGGTGERSFGGVVHGQTGISLSIMASSKKIEKFCWGAGTGGALHSLKAHVHPIYSLGISLCQRMNLDCSFNPPLQLSPSACSLPPPLCCAALESFPLHL